MFAIRFGHYPITRTDDMALISDLKFAMISHALSAELADDVSGAIIAFVSGNRRMVAVFKPLNRFIDSFCFTDFI